MKSKRPAQILFLFLTFTAFFFQCQKDPDPVENVPPPVGTTIDTMLHSPGLEGNLLGDSPDRQVLIYLPPGYEDDQSKRYPIIYILHGYTQDPEYLFKYIPNNMTNGINKKEINPMIVVIPDAYNAYGGSEYTNSQVTGQWEDFIVQDLVQFMDNNFRTVASAGGRGIAGHSMGGYGAIKLAMKYPGIFCAVYGLSPAPASMADIYFGPAKEFFIQAVQSDDFNSLPSWQSKSCVAGAAAFAPNPNSLPYYGELPFTESGDLIDSTWQKWLTHDLYSMIPSYKDNLLSLRSIQFDCGTSDQLFYDANVSFSRELNNNSVEHVFSEYDGNHTNRLNVRIEDYLIPFFSDILDHE